MSTQKEKKNRELAGSVCNIEDETYKQCWPIMVVVILRREHWTGLDQNFVVVVVSVDQNEL